MPPALPDDPLGLRKPSLEDMFAKVVDERIREAWRAVSHDSVGGIPDAVLCMELISRGWVVYKPRHPEVPE